jgi:hypothetical protein
MSYTVLFDNLNPNIEYIGWAQPGIFTDQPYWAIMRVTTVGSLITVEWADGNTNLDKIWDDRANYIYDIFSYNYSNGPQSLITLLDYYTNLLIIQYHDKPKAQATIQVLLNSLFPINQATGNLLFEDIRDAYNLDTAVGVNLDVIGKYVGVDRNWEGHSFDNKPVFCMFDSNFDIDNQYELGFSAPTNKVKGKFLGPKDVLSQANRLIDDDYRILIKLKIVRNNINNSVKSIKEGLYKFFSTAIQVFSNGSKRMTLAVDTSLTPLIKAALQKDVFPRPMGVAINLVKFDPNTNYFCMVGNTGFIPTNSHLLGMNPPTNLISGTMLRNTNFIKV